MATYSYKVEKRKGMYCSRNNGSANMASMDSSPKSSGTVLIVL